MPVHADGETTDASKQVVIQQFLMLNGSLGDVYVPNVTFTYSIEGSDAVTENNKTIYSGTPAALNSKVTGLPTIGTATFTPSQTTYTTKGTTQLGKESYPIDDIVTLDDNVKSYAKSPVTIDFSKVTFNEPGIYRYLVTQKSLADASSYTMDTNTTRILDVYVYWDDTESALKISQYVLRNKVGDEDTAKTSGFKATFNTVKVTLVNTVSGNESRTDQYFTYTLSFYLPTGMKAKVTTSSKDATTSAITYVVSDKTDSSNKSYAQCTVKLAAGDSITISGLPVMTNMTGSTDSTTLTYTPTVAANGKGSNAVGENLGTTNTTEILKGILTADATVTVNNDKGGIIPTGVIIQVAPYATVALAGFAGLIVLARRKKSKEEDEEDK